MINSNNNNYRPMVSICSDLSMKELDDLVQMASDINRQLSTRVCSTLVQSIYLRNQI